MSVLAWILVPVLGGAGALARFLVDGAVNSRRPHDFPAGTLVVNVTGAFLLGLLAGVGVDGHLLLLAGTAALGAYTTFSTWMFETHRLAAEGRLRHAVANVALSLAAGIAAAVAGRAIGGML
jgi:CrcB protein